MKIKRLFNPQYRSLYFPLLLEQVFLTLIGNFNVFLFSLYNDQLVAAIGIADQVLSIGTMVTNIVALGSNILILQGADRKKSAYVKSLIREAILLNLFIGLVLVVLVFSLDKKILSLMQTPMELRGPASVYLKFVSISIFFLSLTTLGLTLLRAFGYVNLATKVSVTSTLLTILGNSLVVGLKLGGIEEVALASLISRFLGALLATLTVRKKLPEISGFLRERSNRENMKAIVKLGLPSAMEGISYNFSQTIITALVASLGTVAVSAKIYTQTITALVFSLGAAGGICGQLTLGNYIRKGEEEKIEDFALLNANGISELAAIFNILLALSGSLLVGIFTDNPEISSLVKRLLYLQILLDPMRCANECLVNELNVLKDVVYPVKIGILVTYIFVIPIFFLLVKKLGQGILAIWLIFILDESLRRYLLTRRIRSKKWKGSKNV